MLKRSWVVLASLLPAFVGCPKSSSTNAVDAAPAGSTKPSVSAAPSAPASASASASASTSASGSASAAPPSKGGAMVFIAGGTFQMGSNEGSADEKPVHEVKMPDFWLDKTEVTVAAYEECVGAGHCRVPDKGARCNAGKAGRESHPINCVDWDQATAYCTWVEKSLPTEEQWEYAAAAGAEQRKYPWGGDAPAETHLRWKADETSPVGGFAAGNAKGGVQDLAGNVQEWTQTGYAPDYSKGGAADKRVVRGGAFNATDAAKVRAASRDWSGPSKRTAQVGFRCAK